MSRIPSIFITGLHRSGTTILDMILGAHSSCVAVGEVRGVIRPDRDRQWVEDHYELCTCGKCEFWPAVMRAIDQRGSDELDDRYDVFLKTFAEHFPGKIPIDSSKHLDALHAISKASECKSVRIVRDVRGWCTSRADRVTPRNMFRWYQKNRSYQRSTPNAIRVGYEPLVLDIENTVQSLCNALSLEFEPGMLEFNNVKGHIMAGNYKLRTNKSHKIKYDGRWMGKTSIWPALLMPIMKYNSRQVYGKMDSQLESY